MTALIALRTSGTIGEVVDFIAAQPHMRLPEPVEEAERRLADAGPEPVEEIPARHPTSEAVRSVRN
jgi:DNA helicase-2/ATP-dependent DNA helicase PcrA